MHCQVRKTQDFLEAVKLLKLGEIVAVPTETVYGLAASISNLEAVRRVFQYKNRPFSDPLIVHVAAPKFCNLDFEVIPSLDSDADALWDGYIDDLIAKKIVHEGIQKTSRKILRELMMNFWPGPLSLCVLAGEGIDPLLTAGSEYVVIRCPAHKIFQNILQKVESPLAAPSANKFEGISPTSAEDVEKEFPDLPLLVVDGGRCMHGIESTILKVDAHTANLTLLRPGAISRDLLKEKGFDVQPNVHKKSVSPGSFKKHYAPRKSCLCLLDKEALDFLRTQEKYQDILSFSEPISNRLLYYHVAANEISVNRNASKTSSDVDLDVEADELVISRNFYKNLRECDESNSGDLIILNLSSLFSLRVKEAMLDRAIRASSGRYYLQTYN